MTCQWCKVSLPAREDGRRPGTNGNPKKWCSKKCRQTAFRFRKLGVARDRSDKPLRLAYADPPYPGNSKKYYGKHPAYGGEVDHKKLVSLLATYDGWALSTSRKALRNVLSLTPASAIVCPWVKPHHQPLSLGPGNVHEYVIVVPGRMRQPGPPDAFYGSCARGGDSKLVGRKPIKFVHWVFQLLGSDPSDTLDDIFPGSGIVGRCWEEYRRLGPAPGDVAGIPETTTLS